MSRRLALTEVERELREAARANAFHGFLTRFKTFGGEGWWEPEKILLPPPARQFRYDACHGDSRVLLEIQGGIWLEHGAHNTGSAINRDAEKLNFACYNGYAVLQLTTDMLDESKYDPHEVFIPLVAFVKERAEMLQAMKQPQIHRPGSGKVGVW